MTSVFKSIVSFFTEFLGYIIPNFLFNIDFVHVIVNCGITHQRMYKNLQMELQSLEINLKCLVGNISNFAVSNNIALTTMVYSDLKAYVTSDCLC